ncbi:hypothetical protein BMS3Abin16_00987 [archaeon BMS3Abin16]|nr:hypothetical protein BMS3Abin16_00987 [archaeon BMS3Abin16]HDY73887.1 hypothetical protein [Euryarchaeota archaeon]
MTETLGLLVFEDENDVPKFTEDFNFTISREGYLTRDNEPIVCSCCNLVLKPKNLGAILPGSEVFYCADETCLADYVSEYLEK